MDVLYGFHAVEEALRSGSRAVEYVAVSRERAQGPGPRSPRSAPDPRLEALMQLARDNNVTVRTESRDALTRLAQSDQHQGAVAVVRPRPTLALEDLLLPPTTGQPLFLLALDGVEDPHNLGALLRTADGAGVTGILIPDRRSAPLNSTVARTSAGASEHVRIARVPNLNRALETIKESNVWTFGLDERGTQDYDAADYTANTCLVLGREGEGLHELTRRHCDFLVRIPMSGAIASLNVSVAGAIVMYEAARQRRVAAASSSPSPAVPAKTPPPSRPQKGLGS
jgi:23S rRNA (guanosine2251-2'-O)-methyltransferase